MAKTQIKKKTTLDFLQSEPEKTEINPDNSVFIPIWQVEKDLDFLCGYNWARHTHQYSLHPDHEGKEWLATSIIIETNYDGMKRVLIGSSFIDPNDYPTNSNILQTGIAEATKAGVKVLGKRFGYELNDRTSTKNTPKKNREPVRARPDEKIMGTFNKAIMENDKATIEKLLSIYDIKYEYANVES